MTCSDDKTLNNFEIVLSDQMICKVQKVHQQTVDNEAKHTSSSCLSN